MMELQLGLALPSIATTHHVRGFEFDLNNSYVYEPKDSDPSSWNINSYFGSSASVPGKCSTTNSSNGNKKRSCDDAFDYEQVRAVPPRTLPLFNWNSRYPDDEDDPRDLDNNSSFGSNKYLLLTLSKIFSFMSCLATSGKLMVLSYLINFSGRLMMKMVYMWLGGRLLRTGGRSFVTNNIIFLAAESTTIRRWWQTMALLVAGGSRIPCTWRWKWRA